MPKTKEQWLLVADAVHARLLRGAITEHQRLHLDEIAALQTTFTAGEHHRPSMLSGAGHTAGLGHEQEERTAHFAREVAKWLAHELPARGVAECLAIAPSHFLGALRKELPKPLAKSIQEHAGELANLSAGQLAAHPAVAGHFHARGAGG